MPTNKDAKPRKYATEWGLAITVFVELLGRQRELMDLSVNNLNRPCNLYIISRQPKITIDPSTVKLEENASLTFRIQYQDSHAEYPVTIPIGTDSRPLRWESRWPYEEFAIYDSDGDVFLKGVTALLLNELLSQVPNSPLKQEVLYIGQAFGKHGERSAFDRLKGHETLQHIYAHNRPDSEIWIGLCSISDVHLMSEISPRTPTQTSDEDDDRHTLELIQRVERGEFREKEAVALAEAGMIRYFQPEYNVNFKNNFPDRRHVSMQSCYGLDLNELVVELQAQDVYARYHTKSTLPGRVHFMRFPLHSVDNRPQMLELVKDLKPLW
jgi:hypothetical protein